MEKGTTILFGLSGVAVERVERVSGEDGEPVRLVHVTTAASSAAGCPVCGVTCHFGEAVPQGVHREHRRDSAAGEADRAAVPEGCCPGRGSSSLRTAAALMPDDELRRERVQEGAGVPELGPRESSDASVRDWRR
jgi:hypothetical protein